MSFNCTIRFTGLCAFVPNKTLGSSPEQMCVVLVDGRSEGTLAMDGTELRRHRGFVLFDLRNLSPGTSSPPTNNRGVWYLDKQRVMIETDSTTNLDTSSYNAAIDADYDFDSPPAGTETSLSWIAGLTKLMPGFASLDSACVSAAPPASVLSQVFFNKGSLNAGALTEQLWSVSGPLCPNSTRQPFAHEAVLTLTGITSLKLKAKDLTTSTIESLDLVPGTLGSVDITIANLCDDNPLRWPRTPDPKDDDDFKWYYALMSASQRQLIRTRLLGAPLPAPLTERTDVAPNATGVNCFPGRAAEIAFSWPPI